jgi:ribonucleoside-diphosphate reductase alpha chain
MTVHPPQQLAYIAGIHGHTNIVAPCNGCQVFKGLRLSRLHRITTSGCADPEYQQLAAIITEIVGKFCVAGDTRRIGLGITGLADTLVLLGLRYDSEDARSLAAQVMQTIRDAAYRASIELAEEKGAFPAFDAAAFLASGFAARLPDDIRSAIAAQGIRNSHLLAIAPTGTISLLANNLSSGIEPVFAAEAERRVLDTEGNYQTHRVVDAACQIWRQQGGCGLPPAWIEAQQLDPLAHLGMQDALQPYIDNAISKTINVAADIPFGSFEDLYRQAHSLGLKGCTVFRPNPVTGAILSEPAASERVQCCDIEREAD